MDRIKVDDLKLRPEVFAVAARAPGQPARRRSTTGMPEIEKAVAKYDLDEYYEQGAEPGHLRPGPRGVRPDARKPTRLRDTLRPQHVRPELPAGPPAGRGRHARRRSRSGRRSPTRDNHSWDVHVGLSKRMKNQSAPMLDAGLSALIADLDERGLLEGHAGGGRRRVRPQPAARRQHLRQRQQRRRPRPLAVLLHRRHRRRRHQARLRPRQERQDRLAPRSRTRSTRPNCWRRSTTPSASTRTRSSTTTSTSRAAGEGRGGERDS